MWVWRTYRKEIKLATKDETPVTMITALAKRLPVPPEVSPLAAKCSSSSAVNITSGASWESSALQAVYQR